MSRRFAFACVVFAVNLAFVAWGRGSFGHMLALLASIPVAFVAVCVGLLMFQFGRPSASFHRAASSTILFGAVVGSCLLSFPIGSLVNRYEIARAKRYCERLRAELERYRHAHGQYPERLSQVPVRGPLPRLLKGSDFYHPRGGGYYFTVADPSRIIAGYDFDSRVGVWCYWD